jgi:hypothetical protein
MCIIAFNRTRRIHQAMMIACPGSGLAIRVEKTRV